jgi:hypothetical protein
MRDRLTRTILDAYPSLGSGLGWRLLYSPENVLDGARVALVGLNPAGHFEDPDHGVFAMARGSAYVTESWHGDPPGCSPLQRQVRSLFALLNVEPEAVLAGNLVPYRDPHFLKRPKDRQQRAIALGERLWAELLASARPELIVCLGNESWASLSRVTRAGASRHTPIGWGSYTAERASFPNGTIVRLPHLSRFAIFGRPESEAGIRRTFHGWIPESRSI